MKLVDTSVFIGWERGAAIARARIAELLESGELAVSVVTLYELLCSATLPAAWRRFYEDLFAAVPVLPVTAGSARLAAEAAARAGAVKAPDALIAGVALEHALAVVTADSGFLALGAEVELLRPS